MTEEYNFLIKVRNNYLLERMRAAGMNTAAELSRACGVSKGDVGDFLNLKRSPYTRGGNLAVPAKKICEALYCDVEDIFPPDHINSPLKTNAVEIAVRSSEVARLMGSIESPEQLLEDEELRQSMLETLSSLTERQRKVLESRYGFNGESKTLKEVGKEIGVTVERVRQIEGRALRTLRHPMREHLN